MQFPRHRVHFHPMYIYSRTVNIYTVFFEIAIERRLPTFRGITNNTKVSLASLFALSNFHETKNRIFRRFRFSSCLEDRIEVLRIEYIVTISNMIQKTRSRSIILPIFLFIIYIFINYLLILIACIHL